MSAPAEAFHLSCARIECRLPTLRSNAWKSNLWNLQRRRPYINLGLSLAASPARLRVSQGRTALRSVAHSAMRPHRGVALGVPVCPPREHVAPRPLRRIALQSVLARGQNHPSASSVSRVRSRRLPARVGQTYRQTHTHERGSISSGWPPNQPASRIAKLFGKGGARGGVSPVFDGLPVVGDAPGKLLRPASRRLRRP